MTLRNTIRELTEAQQRKQQPLLKNDAMLTEWMNALKDLYVEIAKYLREYHHSGALTFSTETIQLRERTLGSYTAPALSMKAGTAVVRVRPIGRLINGTTGRVDLVREGSAAELREIMLVRVDVANDDAALVWKIRLPKKPVLPFLGDSKKKISVPMNKQNLEQAINLLLKLPSVEWGRREEDQQTLE
jgi:hypothetical protein